jgi:hypothetical protein
LLYLPACSRWSWTLRTSIDIVYQWSTDTCCYKLTLTIWLVRVIDVRMRCPYLLSEDEWCKK